MRKSKQKGTILITLIIAMMLIGVLGAGIYSLTTSSTFTGLLSNNNGQAYHLAQAGVRYAIDKIIQANSNYPSTDFLLPDSNHKFNITVVNNVITSIGIVNAGTFSETRRQIIYNVVTSWDSGGGGGTPPPVPTPGGPTISLPIDAASFTPTQSGAGAITVASDGSITLGGGATGNSGTILYQGSSSISNCINGACNFPYGFRAYFEFTGPEDQGTTYGDGFTFGIFSAINNTRDRSGGAPTGVDLGELGGYAGPDKMTDQLGLKPPKIAMEFDTYANTGAMTYNGCSGGRNDGANNHIAVMFWGQNLAGNCNANSKANGYLQASFDDNVHGAGDGTSSNPYNSALTGNGSGLGGYYSLVPTTNTCKSSANNCNWMEDGYPYGFRMEIVRINGTGNPVNGLYQIYGWIYRLDNIPAGMSTSQFQDVTTPFTYPGFAPQISRIQMLDPTNHDALRQIFFGFTESTGAASQNIIINNLKVFFPQALGTCTYYISPASAVYGFVGGSGTVSVYGSRPDCSTTSAWTAISQVGWITVNSGSTGSGNGTVTYTVASNSTARAGIIKIAGQDFPVTQGCTLTIADNSFACKSTGNNRAYINVYLTDGAGNPVTDATSVTYTVSGGQGSGTLTNNGGGYYGGNQTSNCGLPANCARTGSFNSSQTVTVTATRAGCTGSPLTKTMTVP